MKLREKDKETDIQCLEKEEREAAHIKQRGTKCPRCLLR